MSQKTSRAKQPNHRIISMNGLVVGSLTKTKQSGMVFQYNDEWLGSTQARPLSLSMPLRRDPYSGSEVFNYFDNLLPDRKAIRDRVISRFKVESDHPFDILSAIGSDCVGAIQVHSEQPSNVRQITGESLNEHQIAELIRGYRVNPLGMDSEADFRISLAGAQEKTALLFFDGQWIKPTGTTATTHILKFPIGTIDTPSGSIDLSNSCENEWLCLEFMALVGIPTAKSDLLHFEDQTALSVTRFDRRLSDDGAWILRLPQEDFCQALNLPSSMKYQEHGGPGMAECLELLQASNNAANDRETFLQSQILFYLMGAIDGHAKNFSLFHQAGSRYEMTPIYDVMSIHNINNKQLPHKARLAMSWKGQSKNNYYSYKQIQPRHLFYTCEQYGYEGLVEQFLTHLDAQLSDITKVLFDKARQQGANEHSVEHFISEISNNIKRVQSCF